MRWTRRLVAATVSLVSAAALAAITAPAEAADESIPAACPSGTVNSASLLSDDFNPDTPHGTTWDFDPSYSTLPEPKFAVVQRDGADGDTWRLHVDQPTKSGRVAAQSAVPVTLPAGRQVQLELRHENKFEYTGGEGGAPKFTSTAAHVEVVEGGWGDSVAKLLVDSNGMRTTVKDVSDYAGKAIAPRFAVYVGADVPTAPGWDIDDVAIYTCDRATPSAPHSVTTLGGVGRAELSWQPPTWSGTSPITGYRVGVSPGDRTINVPADQTKLVIPNLQAGTDYDFVLQAVNGAGAGRLATASLEGSKLSISGTKTITYGGSTVIAGDLTDVSGTSRPGKIRLVARKKGTSAWRTDQARETGVDGYSFDTWGPWTNFEFHARFDGDSWRVGSASPVMTVYVRPKVSGSWADSTVRRGETAKFNGEVQPFRSGQVVHLQRLIDGKWRYVTSKKLTCYCQYQFSRTSSTRGTFKYRTYVPANADFTAGYSPIRTLYVS